MTATKRQNASPHIETPKTIKLAYGKTRVQNVCLATIELCTKYSKIQKQEQKRMLRKTPDGTGRSLSFSENNANAG